jgi:hypothetical protein
MLTNGHFNFDYFNTLLNTANYTTRKNRYKTPLFRVKCHVFLVILDPQVIW